jgi:sulfur relay protein TusB/DsrH
MRLFQLTHPQYPALLDLASAGDAILLRQDAVYLLLQQQQWPCQLYVLQTDLQIRGLTCPAHVRVLTDPQWVELTLTATQVIACLN